MDSANRRGVAFLPDKFPSPSTCWRRLKQWEDEDLWLEAWRALLARWVRRVCLKGREPPLRGEKRSGAVGLTRCGKGSKIMAIAAHHGLPSVVELARALPHETGLVETAIPLTWAAGQGEFCTNSAVCDVDVATACCRQSCARPPTLG